MWTATSRRECHNDALVPSPVLILLRLTSWQRADSHTPPIMPQVQRVKTGQEEKFKTRHYPRAFFLSDLFATLGLSLVPYVALAEVAKQESVCVRERL